MIVWVLILFAHVGPMGNGNSNALTSVTGFASEAECMAAGKKAADLANGHNERNKVRVRGAEEAMTIPNAERLRELRYLVEADCYDAEMKGQFLALIDSHLAGAALSYEEIERHMHRQFDFGRNDNTVSAQCELQHIRIKMGWTGPGASVKPAPPPAASTREPPHCSTCSCGMEAPPQPASQVHTELIRELREWAVVRNYMGPGDELGALLLRALSALSARETQDTNSPAKE